MAASQPRDFWTLLVLDIVSRAQRLQGVQNDANGRPKNLNFDRWLAGEGYRDFSYQIYAHSSLATIHHATFALKIST
jgi:hypothetical protein